MKDAMISVRLPSALVKELKTIAETNHYLDLSEQIREILRIKCDKYLKEPTQEKKETPTDKERLVQNLQSIIEQLKRDL